MESNIEQYRAWARGDHLIQMRDIAQLVDGSTSAWIHIAPYGEWKGHEKGAFKVTEETVDKIIANYSSHVTPAMVDYEHDSLNGQSSGPKLAAGWIKSLEKRDDGLWAFVEFVPRAVKYIQAGEIKFVSPAIDFRSKDRRTGKSVGPELINIALTNMPFLDGLEPIKLTRFNMGNTIKETHIVEKPSEQLELSEPAQMQDEAPAMSPAIEALASAAGLEPAAVEAALLEKVDEIVPIITNVSQEEGSEAEQEMSIAAATDKPEEATTVAASLAESIKDKTIVQLSQRLEQLEKIQADKDQAAIEALVDEKIKTGYITDDMRDDAIKLYASDRAQADRLFSFKRVPLEEVQVPAEKRNAKPDSELSDQEELQVQSLIQCSMGAQRKLTREKAIERVISFRKN